MLAEVGNFNSGVYEELLTLGISLKLLAFGPLVSSFMLHPQWVLLGTSKPPLKEISPVLLIFTSFISSP